MPHERSQSDEGAEAKAGPRPIDAADLQPRPPRPRQQRRKRFVLFGDSITQQSFAPGGWGARLADAYARRADVVLRGYSGYNTEWALPLVPEVFLPSGSSSDGRNGGGGDGSAGGGDDESNEQRRLRRPNALVTIFFGANDAALPDRHSARQHVPLERFRRNLAEIARAAAATVEPGGLVLLVSCPPVDEEARAAKLAADRLLLGPDGPPPPQQLPPLPERTNEAARAYSRAAAEVAESLSSPSSFASSSDEGQTLPKAEDAAAEAKAAAAAAAPRVAFLDLWQELGGASCPVATEEEETGDGEGEGGRARRGFLSDGLHLSELGNLRVFGCVSAAIEEHRPRLGAAALPLDFPDHSTMEPCAR